MLAVNTIVASALMASTALAHFTLDFPQTRGFDDDKEPQFCGGFPSVSATRAKFPLKGPIWIDSHHKTASVAAFVSTSQNPTTGADFNATSDGTAIPLLTQPFAVPQGERCWNVDFSSLNLGLKNGSTVTLLIDYNGGDSPLFQCADLVIDESYQVPANWTCSQDAAVLNTTTADNSSSTHDHSSGSSTSGSASSTASSPAATTSKSSAERLTAGALGVVSLVAAAALL